MAEKAKQTSDFLLENLLNVAAQYAAKKGKQYVVVWTVKVVVKMYGEVNECGRVMNALI